MSDADKAAALEKKRQFDELSPEQRERMRRLHAELSADPDRERLLGVLERYCEWLKILTAVERAEVIRLPGNERIAKIKDLLRTQETERFRKMAGGNLDPGDLKAIRQWLDEFVDAHADQILATLPPERRDRIPADGKMDPGRRLSMLRGIYLRGGGGSLPRPSAADEDRLRARLSRDAAAVLNKAESDEDRSRLIDTWIRAADFSRVWAHVSVEELQEFAQESLDEHERARLESLPREQMYRELRWLYNQRRFGDAGRRKPPGGSGWRGGGERGPPPPRGPGEEPGGESGRPPGFGPGRQPPAGKPPRRANDPARRQSPPPDAGQPGGGGAAK